MTRKKDLLKAPRGNRGAPRSFLPLSPSSNSSSETSATSATTSSTIATTRDAIVHTTSGTANLIHHNRVMEQQEESHSRSAAAPMMRHPPRGKDPYRSYIQSRLRDYQLQARADAAAVTLTSTTAQNHALLWELLLARPPSPARRSRGSWRSLAIPHADQATRHSSSVRRDNDRQQQHVPVQLQWLMLLVVACLIQTYSYHANPERLWGQEATRRMMVRTMTDMPPPVTTTSSTPAPRRPVPGGRPAVVTAWCVLKNVGQLVALEPRQAAKSLFPCWSHFERVRKEHEDDTMEVIVECGFWLPQQQVTETTGPASPQPWTEAVLNAMNCKVTRTNPEDEDNSTRGFRHPNDHHVLHHVDAGQSYDESRSLVEEQWFQDAQDAASLRQRIVSDQELERLPEVVAAIRRRRRRSLHSIDDHPKQQRSTGPLVAIGLIVGRNASMTGPEHRQLEVTAQSLLKQTAAYFVNHPDVQVDESFVSTRGKPLKEQVAWWYAHDVVVLLNAEQDAPNMAFLPVMEGSTAIVELSTTLMQSMLDDGFIVSDLSPLAYSIGIHNAALSLPYEYHLEGAKQLSKVDSPTSSSVRDSIRRQFLEWINESILDILLE